MEKDTDPKGCSLWGDWENKIISFHKLDDFEDLRFPTQEEMLASAVEKSNFGFKIQ